MASNPFRRAEIDLFPFDVGHSASESGGRRVTTLPELVSHNATHNPDHVFCIQGRADSSKPFVLTFGDFDRTVEACCQWLFESIEREPDATGTPTTPASRPTVAIFLESDISIFAWLVALLRCNFRAVILSIRLSQAAIRHLIDSTDCQLVLTSERLRKNIESCALADGHSNHGDASTREDRTRCRLMIAPKKSKLDSTVTDSARNELAQKLLHNAQRWPTTRDPVVFLHSSGTTGLPKPIGLAAQYPLGYACCHELDEDVDESQTGINLSTLPLYHGFGLLAPCLSLSVGKTCYLPPSTVIPNAALMNSMLRYPGVTSLMTVPSILDDLLTLESADWGLVKKLDFVAVGGGAMRPSTAEELHGRGVQLLNHFGATELGALAPIFRPGPDYDWHYLRLRRDMRLELHPVSSGPDEAQYELVGHPFGWDKVFKLQDRIVMNPLAPLSAPEIRLLGRLDDVLVLANGEKVTPGVFESAVAEHELVKTAVLFGEGRFQLGLLVEPSQKALDQTTDPTALREILWTAVSRANSHADGHARISSIKAIMLLPAGAVIPRSDKGSVQRRELYKALQEDIITFFDGLDEDKDAIDALGLQGKDVNEDVKKMVSASLTHQEVSHVPEASDDLMEAGLDSLALTKLRRLLKAYVAGSAGKLSVTSDSIRRDFVYRHSSIDRMVAALTGSLEDSTATEEDQDEMLQMLDDFIKQLPYSTAPPAAVGGPTGLLTPLDVTVLITGSTGNLGAHVVHQLAKDPGVDQIHCLLRRPTAGSQDAAALAARQKASLDSHGLALSEAHWAKLTFHAWKVGDPDLGLDSTALAAITNTVTHVFHGAWPMSFTRTLTSLRAHVQGLADLVKLLTAAHSSHPQRMPRLLFASSIAAVGLYQQAGVEASKESAEKVTTVTEVPLTRADIGSQLPMGYAQAKWVCELFATEARNRLAGHVDVSVVRIGQLAGSEDVGSWSTDEHMAKILQASAAIGTLPELHGDASWLPLNIASAAISQLLLSHSTAGPLYNLENPTRQQWSRIIDTFRGSSPHLKDLPLTPYASWLAQAKDKAAGSTEGIGNFLENHFLRLGTGKLRLDTTLAQETSEALRYCGEVRPEVIRRYLAQWDAAGLFQKAK